MIIRSERKQISPGQFQYRFSEDAREVGTADFIRERSRQTGVHIQVSEKRAELIIPTLFTGKRTGNGVEKEAAKICLEEENTSVFYHTQKGSNIFNGIYFCWTGTERNLLLCLVTGTDSCNYFKGNAYKTL